MENLQIELIASLTPQVLMALVGALIGGLLGVRDRFKEYGFYLTLLLVISSVMIGGAVVDYLAREYHLKSLLLSWVIGLGFGIFGSMAVDMLRLTSPSLAEKLVNGMGNEAVETAIDMVKRKRVVIQDSSQVDPKPEDTVVFEHEPSSDEKSNVTIKKPVDSQEIE